MLLAEDGASHISYRDFALAIVDEIDSPPQRRTLAAVADQSA